MIYNWFFVSYSCLGLFSEWCVCVILHVIGRGRQNLIFLAFYLLVVTSYFTCILFANIETLTCDI